MATAAPPSKEPTMDISSDDPSSKPTPCRCKSSRTTLKARVFNSEASRRDKGIYCDSDCNQRSISGLHVWRESLKDRVPCHRQSSGSRFQEAIDPEWFGPEDLKRNVKGHFIRDHKHTSPWP
ncbi:hypothetical protein PIB30_088366 [Stylosanthes scabra]|uniref:Uncharacterized protein n=1 Tax=Stylosanthes scabra TaxID=79078 RepID=A0ABU6VU01_9FABA|nr:hypothetical protein [Stylosanthes scabra]